MSRKGKSRETVNYWLPMAKGIGGNGEGVLMDIGFLFEVLKKDLKLIIVMETQFFEYTNNRCIV